jgi:exonuclease III
LPGEESNITSKVDKKMKNWDNGFKIGHLNIRSLVKNIDQLRIYLSNQQYDIICINETWLDDKINNYEVNIDGYNLVRKGRRRTGGGVAMYIRNSIAIKLDKT